MLMTEPQDTRRKATPLQVAKAVFWSFLGIRKRAAHEHDAVTIKPVQVIIAGLIGAAIFVSTLIMLVSAFASREKILSAYRHAVEARYRFYSYGDCMFIDGE